jgi:hypothetical protein
MKLSLSQSTLFGMLLSTASFACFAAAPPGLIKVTGENTEKCVEYYSYQGESYCSTTALSSRPAPGDINTYEMQNIIFDNRPWQAAWGRKSDDSVVVEYIPMGDDINNWKELVTSQFFSGLDNHMTPKQFAETVIKGMVDLGFKPIVTFIKSTPDQVIFEFRIDKPENQVQDELQMITKGINGFYVLHYVIKKADMGQAARDQWLNNFANSKIK